MLARTYEQLTQTEREFLTMVEGNRLVHVNELDGEEMRAYKALNRDGYVDVTRRNNVMLTREAIRQLNENEKEQNGE